MIGGGEAFKRNRANQAVCIGVQGGCGSAYGELGKPVYATRWEVYTYIDGGLLNTAVVIEAIIHGRERIQKGAKSAELKACPC